MPFADQEHPPEEVGRLNAARARGGLEDRFAAEALTTGQPLQEVRNAYYRAIGARSGVTRSIEAIERRIRQVVEGCPPPTEEQVARLRAAFRLVPGGEK